CRARRRANAPASSPPAKSPARSSCPPRHPWASSNEIEGSCLLYARQYLSSKNVYAIDFRPAGNDELSHSDSLVLEKCRREIIRCSEHCRPNRTVVRHESRPQPRLRPEGVALELVALAIHLRIVFQSRGAFFGVIG